MKGKDNEQKDNKQWLIFLFDDKFNQTLLLFSSHLGIFPAFVQAYFGVILRVSCDEFDHYSSSI